MHSEQQHFVSKPWGWENWIVNNADYCGKVLFVKQGKQCSWHYHRQKDETFYVQSGEVIVRYYDAKVTRTAGNKWWKLSRVLELFFEQRVSYETTPFGEKGEYVASFCNEVVLRAGESFHVPVGMLHQFYGNLDTTIIEFSTHHEDSDSYRVVSGDGKAVTFPADVREVTPLVKLAETEEEAA